MKVELIKVDIVSVSLDINEKFVELTVRDTTNHLIKLELDEINVNNWILDEAYAEAGLDDDPTVEGYSVDELHHQRMNALYEYLADKDTALLGMSSIGIKLRDCDNI